MEEHFFHHLKELSLILGGSDMLKIKVGSIIIKSKEETQKVLELISEIHDKQNKCTKPVSKIQEGLNEDMKLPQTCMQWRPKSKSFKDKF